MQSYHFYLFWLFEFETRPHYATLLLEARAVPSWRTVPR